jgi:hypothetical protein
MSPRSGWMRASRSAPCWPRRRGGPALAHLDVDPEGFAWLPEDDFVNHFAAQVDPVKARVMFTVSSRCAGEVMGVPAWRALPSWFLVAVGDQEIPPAAQRVFAPRMGATTVEVSTNHVAIVFPPRQGAAAHQNRRPSRAGRNLSAHSTSSPIRDRRPSGS